MMLFCSIVCANIYIQVYSCTRFICGFCYFGSAWIAFSSLGILLPPPEGKNLMSSVETSPLYTLVHPKCMIRNIYQLS